MPVCDDQGEIVKQSRFLQQLAKKFETWIFTNGTFDSMKIVSRNAWRVNIMVYVTFVRYSKGNCKELVSTEAKFNRNLSMIHVVM